MEEICVCLCGRDGKFCAAPLTNIKLIILCMKERNALFVFEPEMEEMKEFGSIYVKGPSFSFECVKDRRCSIVVYE